MALKRVVQESPSGCFVACAATLLGVPYKDALAKIHPGRYEYAPHHIRLDDAERQLRVLGLRRVKRARTKNLRALNRTAVVTLEWTNVRGLFHTIVFDASVRKFLDPSDYNRSARPTHEYEKQIIQDIYYVDPARA